MTDITTDVTKFKVKINKEVHGVYVVNVNVAYDKKFKKIHRIQIIDLSASDYQTNDKIIEQIKKSFHNFLKDDKTTVIWFNNNGSYSVLFDFQSKIGLNFDEAMKNAQTKTNVDWKFSSVLSYVAEDCLCDGYLTIIDLFTTTTPYRNQYSDLVDCDIILNSINLTSFNIVSYGSRYNRGYLASLAKCVSVNSLTHIDDIDNMCDMFEKNMELAEELSDYSYNFCLNGVTNVPENVVFGEPEASQNGGFGRLKFGKNTFYIITNKLKPASNLEVYDSSKKLIHETNLLTEEYKEANPTVRNSFYYALAYQLYSNNKRREALEILQYSVKDRYLVDLAMGVFTNSDVQKMLDSIKAAYSLTDQGFKSGVCPPNYVPKRDAFCLLNLFKILQESEAVYLPYDPHAYEYNRIGLKIIDTQNSFIPNLEQSAGKFSDLVFNSSELNVSLRFIVPGMVDINKNTAAREGLDRYIPAIIYRSHTFVLDGALNIPSIVVEIPKDKLSLFDLVLKSCTKKLYNTLDSKDGDYFKYEILLNRLPIINHAYSKDYTAKGMFELKHTEITLAAKQKVLNYLIEKAEAKQLVLTNTESSKELVFADYKIVNGVYQGIDNVSAVDGYGETEVFYETRTIELVFEKCSTLPPVDKVLEKTRNKKALTLSEMFIIKAYDDIAVVTDLSSLKADNPDDLTIPESPLKTYLNMLDYLLNQVKNSLLQIRADIAKYKLSIFLTGEFPNGWNLSEQGEKTVYEYKGEINSVSYTALLKLGYHYRSRSEPEKGGV